MSNPEFVASMDDIPTMSFEEFKEMNKGYSPWRMPTEVNEKDWAIAKKCIDSLEKTTGEHRFPVPGDRVVYTDKGGVCHSYARIEHVLGEPGLFETASVYANPDGSCHVSQGSMSHNNLDFSKFKHLGYTSAPFWCFGSYGACCGGGIDFLARVAVWEYVEPDQEFPGYTTENWMKWYVTHANSSGYQYLCESYGIPGYKTAFKTDKEYQFWLKTYRGREFDGYWQDQKVVWGYSEAKISLDKKEWDALDFPLDTRLLNGAIRDCKVNYDDDNHVIEAFFYKVHDEHHSFLYSAESEYPFEFRLEREKNV